MTVSAFRRLLASISPRLVVVFAAIALIPVIYAGLLTASNSDPTHHLDRVPAALVNADTGATAKDGSAVDLGASVADELLSSTSGSNFDWTTMDAREARRELAAGDVYAVLSIPDDFSADVVSTGGDDPAAASVATLSIETNDGSNLIVGTIAKTIGTTVTETLARQVGETYLKNVYLGFTDVHDRLQQAADGAGDLSDGASSAATGSAQLVVGLTQLQAGTASLAGGASALSAGAGDASSGASTLAAGLGRLADATTALPTQAARLDTGASSVAAGAQRVDSGSADLASGADSLSSGATALSTGAVEAAAGADAVATGAASVATGADAALAGGQRLQQGAGRLAAGTTVLATGADGVSTGIRSLLAGYGSLSDQERIAALTALAAGADQVATGADTTAQGAAELSSGSSALVGDDTTGLTALAAGAEGVRDGSATLSTGAGTLAAGASALDSGARDLASGARSLATGASDLDTGASTVSAGVHSFAGGVAPLSSGIATASTGADSLAAGTDALADGAGDLATGAEAAEAGAAGAADGAERLTDGIDSLSTGAGTLADGLTDGAARVPSYTDDEADALSTVAADPVVLDARRLNEVPGYGYGLAPYFLGLALWVGALAFYLMTAPLNERLVVRRLPAWLIALRSYLPGALMGVAQGILAALVLRFAVGIDATNLPGLVGIAVLTSLTFIAINQALNALLDAPGRFLALLLIVLQLSAAGATYPIETTPWFFQVVHGVLPLTYTVEAFRSLIAGGGIGVAQAVLVLVLWLVGALAVTVLAASRRRRGITSAFRDPEPILETA